MIIKSNILLKILTFGFASGLTIWPFIIIKKKSNIRVINHEKIHFEQQKELLVIFFYLWYLIEWLFKGYKNISFEKEAYKNEAIMNYTKHRKHFEFLKYL